MNIIINHVTRKIRRKPIKVQNVKKKFDKKTSKSRKFYK